LPCTLTFIIKEFRESVKAKRLLETTLFVEVCEIDLNEPGTPVIMCSNGTPTGQTSATKEQDTQPKTSALIDLTNFEDDQL